MTSIEFSGITGEDAVHGDEGVAALTDNGTQRRKRKGRRTNQETHKSTSLAIRTCH